MIPRGDGNCWFRAVCDQLLLHDIAYLPRGHKELRKAVIAFIRNHPDFKDCQENTVGYELEEVDETGIVFNKVETRKEREDRTAKNKKKMAKFLRDHAKPGTWTDDSGVICQVRLVTMLDRCDVM